MSVCLLSCACFFFFNDTATTEIYTLSLHDALPICDSWQPAQPRPAVRSPRSPRVAAAHASVSAGTGAVAPWAAGRSEEHTSELQSHLNLVCRLLLEKKKKTIEENHGYKVIE